MFNFILINAFFPINGFIQSQILHLHNSISSNFNQTIVKKILLITTLTFGILLNIYCQCDITYTNANFPTGSLIINSNEHVCVEENVTVSAYTSILIYSGGILKIRNNSTLNLNGSMTLNPGAEIYIEDCNSKLEINGNYTGANLNDCEFKVFCNNCETSPQSNYFTATGSVAYLDICCQLSPLPVEMTYFDAQKNENERCIDYRWGTASEINNDYFEILVSKDGNSWNSISRIPGNGNSFVNKDYFFKSFDLNYTYSKLKQVDFDGTETYSDIIFLGHTQTDLSFLNNRVVVRTETEKQLRVYSITGALLLSKTIPAGTTIVRLDEITIKGIVLVNIGTTTKKVILK
jgi:hypothetical protein